MGKILSVVIPTYNMGEYLDRCLTSLIIREDLMLEIEVLIINDGSTDCSFEIANRYVEKYPHSFRVINKENGHYGSCVNRGLKEATGKYIKLLDADDWFDNSCFEQYVHELSLWDVDLVVTDAIITNGEGGTRESFGFKGIVLPREVFSFQEICKKKFYRYAQMHNYTYKTQILRDLNYTQSEGIAYTDNEWIFHPMVAVETGVYLSFPSKYMYYYLVGRSGQSISDTNINSLLPQYVKLFGKMLTVYENYTGDDFRKQFLHDNLILRIACVYVNWLKEKDKIQDFIGFENAVVYRNEEICRDLENLPVAGTPFKVKDLRKGGFYVWASVLYPTMLSKLYSWGIAERLLNLKRRLGLMR